MATLSILYAANRGICNSTVRKELTDAFPWQRWLRERATVLRCTYTAVLVSYDAVCSMVYIGYQRIGEMS
jgi:hypothetical protein